MQSKRREMFVMSIDPGKTVGWTIGTGDDLYTYGENDRISFMTRMTMALSDRKVHIGRVIMERFDLRSVTNDAYDTVKLIGAIEWALENCFMSANEVTADSKKRFERHPNVVELKKKGMGHAADAEAIRIWDLNFGTW